MKQVPVTAYNKQWPGLVCLKNQAVNDTLSSDYAASRDKQISEHSHQKLQEKIGVIKYG